MKLRVRINKQTSRVDLPGEDPSLKELTDHIRAHVLSSHGLSSDADFGLSLNGRERLCDSGQVLSSCGIVPGDLVCVILPESATAPVTVATTAAEAARSSLNQNQNQQTPLMSSAQPSAGRHDAHAEEEAAEEEELTSTPSAPCWEPLLCCEASDGQAPLSLEILYHGAQVTSPSNAVMVAAHLLMLETGFTPQGCELKPGEMPVGWRLVGGAYKLQYAHPLCESVLAMVVAVEMGPMLVINATLKVKGSVSSVCTLTLSPCSYVTDEWPGESAAAAFKDLSKLSRVFKDQLAYPLIAEARAAADLPVAFGLTVLPLELLLRVFRLLDVRSLARLSTVCRHFQGATADSMLWRHLLRRDFPSADSASRGGDVDWKERYKRLYKLRPRVATRCTIPPYFRNPRDVYGSIPIPRQPPLPGIIGGEFDQRPHFPLVQLPRPPLPPFIQPADREGHPHAVVPRPMRGRSPNILRGFI